MCAFPELSLHMRSLEKVSMYLGSQGYGETAQYVCFMVQDAQFGEKKNTDKLHAPGKACAGREAAIGKEISPIKERPDS